MERDSGGAIGVMENFARTNQIFFRFYNYLKYLLLKNSFFEHFRLVRYLISQLHRLTLDVKNEYRDS